MQRDELIRSRVHRVLRKVERFSPLSVEGSTNFAREYEIKLNPGEELLGLYQNSLTDLRQNVVITNKGIHVFADQWTFVAYEAMNSVTVLIPNDGDKRAAEELVFSLKSEMQIVVPIRGGDDQFRDIWQVDRFFLRVIADFNKDKNN